MPDSVQVRTAMSDDFILMGCNPSCPGLNDSP